MLKCNCEHEDHFNGKKHDYQSVNAVAWVNTQYGEFTLCQECLDTVHKKIDEYDVVPFDEPVF